MKYNFISRTLLVNESIKIVSLYSKLKSWNEVRNVVFEENTLQKNKKVSLEKQLSEIKTRLSLLPENILYKLPDLNDSSIKLILLISACLKYRLLYEFMFEVIRDKYLTFNYKVFDHDYESFIRSKYIGYPKLEDIKQESKIKLRGNIFKILEESGIIDSKESKNIIKPFVSEKVIELVVKFNPSLLGLFLMSDLEIKTYIEKYKYENR